MNIYFGFEINFIANKQFLRYIYNVYFITDPKLENPGVDFELKQAVVLKANDPAEASKKQQRMLKFRRNDVVSE